MNKNKQRMVTIPNFIIKNIGININEKEFMLFAKIKHLHSCSIGENAVSVRYKTINDACHISNRTTFSTCMKNLKASGLLLDYETSKTGLIEIIFNETMAEKKPNTGMPLELFEYVPQIKDVGFRLMYYYESCINKIKGDTYAHPDFETIIRELGISSKTITKYNHILEEFDLLKIDKFKNKDNYEITEFGNDDILDYSYRRNRYSPMTSNIVHQGKAITNEELLNLYWLNKTLFTQ